MINFSCNNLHLIKYKSQIQIRPYGCKYFLRCTVSLELESKAYTLGQSKFINVSYYVTKDSTWVILLWFARNMERFCDSWIDWGSAIFLKNWAALKNKRNSILLISWNTLPACGWVTQNYKKEPQEEYNNAVSLSLFHRKYILTQNRIQKPLFHD